MEGLLIFSAGGVNLSVGIHLKGKVLSNPPGSMVKFKQEMDKWFS